MTSEMPISEMSIFEKWLLNAIEEVISYCEYVTIIYAVNRELEEFERRLTYWDPSNGPQISEKKYKLQLRLNQEFNTEECFNMSKFLYDLCKYSRANPIGEGIKFSICFANMLEYNMKTFVKIFHKAIFDSFTTKIVDSITTKIVDFATLEILADSKTFIIKIMNASFDMSSYIMPDECFIEVFLNKIGTKLMRQLSH